MAMLAIAMRSKKIFDFHTHILPGMDDGCRDTEQAARLLQIEREQGVKILALTPHFYSTKETPEAFLKRRQKALERMPVCEDIQIIPGAEVRYSNGMSQWSNLSKLTLGDTRYILVEMPQPPWPRHMYNELANIQKEQGLIPVIAHIDRYVRPFQTHGILKRLEDLPVLIQANGSFFLKKWTRGLALRMLKAGNIHLLGSDCHNLEHRPPNVHAAYQVIERHLGEKALDYLAEMSRTVIK